MIYVVLAFDLWMRMRWALPRMLLLMFFGVVPVLSFFGERWTHQSVERDLQRRPTLQDQERAEAGQDPAGASPSLRLRSARAHAPPGEIGSASRREDAR